MTEPFSAHPNARDLSQFVPCHALKLVLIAPGRHQFSSSDRSAGAGRVAFDGTLMNECPMLRSRMVGLNDRMWVIESGYRWGPKKLAEARQPASPAGSLLCQAGRMVQRLDRASADAVVNRTSRISRSNPCALRCAQSGPTSNRNALHRRIICGVQLRVGALIVRDITGCHGGGNATRGLAFVKASIELSGGGKGKCEG